MAQTDEQKDFTQEWYQEKLEQLTFLINQKKCPFRDSSIMEILDEMKLNLEYLP